MLVDEDWASLQPPIIARILQYLNRQDRFSTSLVNKNWSKAFNEPQLWTNQRLSFRRLAYSNSDAICLKRFGACVERLTIHLEENSTKRHDAHYTIYLSRVFLILVSQNCQLKCFHFEQFNLCNLWSKDSQKTLVLILGDFLKTQRKLQCASFEGLSVSKWEISYILMSLAKHSDHSLRCLNLKNVLSTTAIFSEKDVETSPLFLFRNLNRLILNYRMMTQGTVLYLCSAGQSTLRSLTIVYSEKDFSSDNVTVESWKRIQDTCPDLKVNLDIVHVSQQANISTLYEPFTHLYGFKLSTQHKPGGKCKIQMSLDNLVRKFKNCLVEVTLSVKCTHIDMDCILLQVLDVSHTLQIFEYCGCITRLPVLGTICIYSIQYLTNLRKLHLLIHSQGDQDLIYVKNLQSEYGIKFERRRVDFKMAIFVRSINEGGDSYGTG